ncbi:MAG: hypothetical protein QOK05_1032 [Chloroflexota bacterium]|jgi:1-acyl-sn-glycerol-3-phosphate acyltransferase|nr:hypothetical protein [Chloroflexota bacterium]
MTRPAAAALPPADLLPGQRRATPAFRIVRLLLEPLVRLVFRWRIEGRENIPRTGPYVAIANHLNWLDPFAVVLACPTEPRVHFLGNPEGLVKHRLQWRLIRSIGGYIAVDPHLRGNTSLYHYVDVCLQAGGAVALFPEGHYGAAEGTLEPFRKGFAHFAVQNQVPVVPMVFSGTADLWLRKPIRVIIGKPIPPGADVDTLVREAQSAMTTMMPAYADPPGRRLLRERLTHLL